MDGPLKYFSTDTKATPQHNRPSSPPPATHPGSLLALAKFIHTTQPFLITFLKQSRLDSFSKSDLLLTPPTSEMGQLLPVAQRAQRPLRLRNCRPHVVLQLPCLPLLSNPLPRVALLFFFLICLFIFIFGCVGSFSGWGYSSLRCAGFSLQWLLLLRSTGSRRTGFSSCGTRALERRFSSCGARA